MGWRRATAGRHMPVRGTLPISRRKSCPALQWGLSVTREQAGWGVFREAWVPA